MLERMQEIESNVSEAHAEIQILAKQIRDENRLLPAEIDDRGDSARKPTALVVGKGV